VFCSPLFRGWFAAPGFRKPESMEVNSIGKMNLVEGLAPSALRVSKRGVVGEKPVFSESNSSN